MVMDDGAPVTNCIRPDTGLFHRIMHSIAPGRAEILQRFGGPCLQSDCPFILFDKVQKTNVAAG